MFSRETCILHNKLGWELSFFSNNNVLLLFLINTIVLERSASYISKETTVTTSISEIGMIICFTQTTEMGLIFANTKRQYAKGKQKSGSHVLNK